LKLFVPDTISEYNERKLRKHRNVILVKGFINVDHAYRACVEFVEDMGGAWIHLDQYNNKDANKRLVELGEEIKQNASDNFYPEINTVVMGVGTGVTLFGLAQGIPEARVVAVTVDDPKLSIPGWKNFKKSEIHKNVLTLNNYVYRWVPLKIGSMIQMQDYFSNELRGVFGAGSDEQLTINLSTTGNLMAAIDECNKYNDSVAVTLCTGLDK
jgi:cysteine synthase